MSNLVYIHYVHRRGDDVPPERQPTSLIPLKPAVLMALLSLAAEPRHGYALMQDVEERSGGDIVLQTGALYRLLKHMLFDGLIEECAPTRAADRDDERRRYYKVTAFGRSVMDADIARMTRVVRAARAVRGTRRPKHA
jgi:DNA-binding PadR family transcriptional regulator